MRAHSPGTATVCVVALVTLISANPATAQLRAPITIPGDLHEGTRRLVGDEITFCVDDRSPASAVDIAIAQALADSQLVQANFFRISEMPGRTDQVVINDDLLFVLLSDECDAFIGMRGGDRVTVAQFVTVTRPYYEARYVLASTRPDLDSFQAVRDANVQLGIPVNSRMNSSVSYFESSTYRRVFPSEQALYDALTAGESEAGLFFGPELVAMAGDDIANLTLSRVDPVPNGDVPIMMLLFVDQTFVRGILDDAIAALEEAGTIDVILDEAGLNLLP